MELKHIRFKVPRLFQLATNYLRENTVCVNAKFYMSYIVTIEYNRKVNISLIWQ
jgi:hypothetical protein